MAKLLAFWLLPREDEAHRFRQIITDLATQCGAPVFEPHVTLCTTGEELPQPERPLASIGDRAAVELEVRDLRWSDKFTKTLFVQFARGHEAAAISESLKRHVPGAGDGEFDPHLSLIYKMMPEEEKAALAARIEVPFKTVHFDQVAVVCSNPEVKTAADVRSWQIVARRELRKDEG